MLKKMMSIFKGQEEGFIWLVVEVVVTIAVIAALAGPPLWRVVTQAPRQFGAGNTVSMDESVSLDQAQDAAREGMHRTMKDTGDVVKGFTPPTDAQGLVIGHIQDTAVAVSTADTKKTTSTQPTVTGQDLNKHTNVCPADDGAAANGAGGNGGGSSSGYSGGYGGGCNDGCGR